MRSSIARFVFDTNVLVSALLHSQGKPRQAFDVALGRGEVLTSLEMLQELVEVLSRPKFDRYLTREERERFLQAFSREAVLVEATEHVDICRDPKDDAVLELAASRGAIHIITGDEELLVLDPFRDIAIVRSDRFLMEFGSAT